MPKRGEVSQFEGGVWGRFDGVDERGEEIWSEVSEEEALSNTVQQQSPLNMDALNYQAPQERRADRNRVEDASGKWQGGDRLRDVAVDAVGGVGRAATSIMGGVLDAAQTVQGWGGMFPGRNKASDELSNTLRTAVPNTFDAQFAANPDSAVYNVAEGTTRAAPYIAAGMTVGGAGAGNMLFNAVRGNSGALMSATKYFLSKGLEGAALDAAVASVVGDPVLPTAAVGGVGTMAGMPFFDRAGLVDAVTKGNVRSSLAAGAEAIGSKGAIDEVYDEATGQTDTFVADMVRRGATAQKDLAADYSEVAKIRLGVGQERGAIALVQVQRTLENDVDAGKYFVETNAKNADALEGGLNQFANRVSGTDPLSAIEGLAKTTREAKDAYISAYHDESWTDVAKVLGMVDAAGNGDATLLLAMPISTKGMVALQNMRKGLVREFDGVPGLESSLAYIDDQIAAISSGTRTIEQVNNASRHFFDADAAVHIPNKAIRQRVRQGLNDAQYDTIAQLGGAKAGNEAAGTKLADQWLTGRTKVAKALDKWESDAISKIQKSVGKTSAANTAKLIAANPEWADDVISFIEGAGQSPEQARRFIARGFVENAISGARTAPGSGGFNFDPAKFVSSLKASRETQGMVLDQKLMDDLDRFAQLSSSMSTPTGGLPIEGQLTEAQLSATTQIQGKNVEQSNQAAGATLASNAASPSSTLYGAVSGWANKRINNYFSQNAISRITMDREAMAMLLTDDSLRQRLIQDMGAAVDAVRRGKVPLMDAKFQVLVKNRIATTDPRLYKRLYGAPAKVGFAGAAVPMFGGSDY